MQNNQLTFDGEFRYTYDDEGNRISKVSDKNRTEYHWDHRNRLVKVVTNGKKIEYKYDYRNRLARRNDEFFVHDGWQIACSLKNGRIVDRYLWGARQDELLCENDHFMLADHLGTVRKVVDRNGKTVSELQFNAFGKLLNCTGQLPRFRYTGKMFDDDTGLQWNVNRWYDPSVGRWASEDPIGFKANDLNLNRYVDNQPNIYNNTFGFWKITRNLDAKAVAKPEVTIAGENEVQYNDTLRTFAEEIHMGIDEILEWITAPNKYKIIGKTQKLPINEIAYDDKWCPGQKVEIPNTIFAAFFARDIDGFSEKFDVDNAFLI